MQQGKPGDRLASGLEHNDGVTQKGIRDQLIIDGMLDHVDGDRGVNADYMQRAIYEAIGKVVVNARLIMDWLQDVASVAWGQGKAVRWTTPMGMQVTQEYLQPKTKKVVTAMQKYFYYVPSKVRKLLKRRQVNGIAPNFIHSIDASHLVAVVLGLRDAGVRDMLMVHDSFGVHACHVDTLHKVIRDTFVQIASTDILGNFKREVEEQTGVTLPDPPECGDLDIRQVLEATYAFC